MFPDDMKPIFSDEKPIFTDNGKPISVPPTYIAEDKYAMCNTCKPDETIYITEIHGALHPWTEWSAWGNADTFSRRHHRTPNGKSRTRKLYAGAIHCATIYEIHNYVTGARFFRVLVGLEKYTGVQRYATYELALFRLKELLG